MKTDRRYDLDWLRVGGVFLVILFHSLMIFILEPWALVYIKDSTYIYPFKAISNFIHLFNMPLLFIIAGMSVNLSLKSRTTGQYLKDRFQKLLLPATFGCIILNPIMTYIYQLSINNTTGFGEYIIGFFTKNPGDLSGIEGCFTPAHLWFLIFLFVYSLLSLPLFIKVSQTKNNIAKKNISDLLAKPFVLIVTVIPILLAAAINILDDKNPLVYFVMFLLGYFLMTSDHYRLALNRDKWGYLAIGGICSFLGVYFGNLFEEWSGMWIMIQIATQIARITIVFALLGMGNSYFNKASKSLKFLSNSSFTIYMIHFLINTGVGYIVIQCPLNPLLKFTTILALTLILSFLFYIIIKPIPLLRTVFGIK